jgi:hypothetical protein
MAALTTFAHAVQNAQGAQRGPAAPAAPAVRNILFDAANALGILRGLRQEDSIITTEYWATGTMNTGGQAYKMTAYHVSINFSFPGLRVDFTRTGPDGQPQRQIHVVSGTFGWNETQPGMNATPALETASQRLVELWTTPMGVVKAATAAGANLKATVEGGATVLTFPLPAPLAGATVKATLNAQHQTARVETRLGNILTETTYSDYGDWNDADYKADVITPRHIVQKQGGVTVLDLTVTRTSTYNPYVVVPVPENVKKAAAAQSPETARH